MGKKEEKYVSNFQKDFFKLAGNHQAFSYLSYVFHTEYFAQVCELKMSKRGLCKHYV